MLIILQLYFANPLQAIFRHAFSKNNYEKLVQSNFILR